MYHRQKDLQLDNFSKTEKYIKYLYNLKIDILIFPMVILIFHFLLLQI